MEQKEYSTQGTSVKKNLLWSKTTFIPEPRGVVQTSPNGTKHLVLDTDTDQIAAWLRQNGYKFTVAENQITVTQLPQRG
jgi:hypothetical protein